MIACPASSTILLPGALPLPGALLCPSALLLPRDGLLPVAERLLLDLTIPLLLLRPQALLLVPLPLLGLLDLLLVPLLLLGPLALLLLLLGLRVLSRLLAVNPLALLLLSALPLLLLPLRTLLSRGWRFPLSPALLLFWLALLFIVPVLLRVPRDSGPEKQQQSSGAHSSNELHTIFSINVDIRYARRQPVRLKDLRHNQCEIILRLLLVEEGVNSSQDFISNFG